MGYTVGIDVGTSYTAAATWEGDGRHPSKAEVVPLGNRSTSIGSVLFLGGDGSVVVGEAAQRRALTDPDRVVREFKRRIGDDTPLVVGGEPHAAHDLAATMVRWVVDRVAERAGGPADRIAVTHPASWGRYKQDLLRTALGAAGLTDLTFLSEPEAAAISYASLERVEANRTIAVYDLGGGTFDAAVVRKTDNGSFSLLGSAHGLEQVGGADFDEAVFTHVHATCRTEFDALDVEDPEVLTALARLRQECTEAKEALSSDTVVSIPVLLPGISSHVRLVRSEFEEMIRPILADTVESLSRALRSAGVTSADLDAVLLVGGSSRIPLVSQMVSAALGCPVVVDADPKATIALGAALSLAPPAEPAPAPPTTVIPPTVIPAVGAPAVGAVASPATSPQQEARTDLRYPPDAPTSIPAERVFVPGHRVAAEHTPPRRKLMTGVVASVIVTVGLIGGAFMIKPVATMLDGHTSLADGAASTTATTSSEPPSGAITGPAASDPAKISVIGSPNASRGRVDTAQTATQTAAEGVQGGRVTTSPPKAAPSNIQPAPTTRSPLTTSPHTTQPTTTPTTTAEPTTPAPTTAPTPTPEPTTPAPTPTPTPEPTTPAPATTEPTVPSQASGEAARLASGAGS